MGLLAGLFVRIVVSIISAALQLALMLGSLLGQLLIAILPHVVSAIGALCRAFFQALVALFAWLADVMKSRRPESSGSEWNREGPVEPAERRMPPAIGTRQKRVPKSYW
jgi:hypothetical protein